MAKPTKKAAKKAAKPTKKPAKSLSEARKTAPTGAAEIEKLLTEGCTAAAYGRALGISRQAAITRLNRAVAHGHVRREDPPTTAEELLFVRLPAVNNRRWPIYYLVKRTGAARK